MTHEDKLKMMRNTVVYLYEKEGRSKSYIAKTLEINRKLLSKTIEEWGLVKADEKHLKPSTQKFLNRNRKIILDMLDTDKTITSIASALKVSRKSILNTYIRNDKELLHHYNEAKKRKEKRTSELRDDAMRKSRLEYYIEDIQGELWADILGYPGYQVSNMGRVRRWAKSYMRYYLIKQNVNHKTGRVYVSVRNDTKTANLSLSRLVAFAFVPGYSSECNTVDHVNGDCTDNLASNLEWVSQSENLRRSYLHGRSKAISYSRNKRFKKIVVDDKYEFSSITAVSRFLEISPTQVSRYLSGECKTDRDLKFVY